MITIISGTNRPQSETRKVAQLYLDRLQAKTEEKVQLLSLEDLPEDIIRIEMYSVPGQSDALAKIQDQYLLNADKLVVVSPEYNGSFPGILKLFLDACSVRELKKTFNGKKAALVGVASGRAGNLRGMDHLTGIFQYLGTTILPMQLPISQIKTLKDDKDQIINPSTLEAMDKQIEAFIKF